MYGGGWVPVGSPVFKTGGGSHSGPRWVRLPSTPALRLTKRVVKVNTENVLIQDSLVERLHSAVRAMMNVEDITRGAENDRFLVRFRGNLIGDTLKAYEQLAPIFEREGMTLLFRQDGEQHAVLAVEGVIEIKPSNPIVNLVLFLLTLMSMLIAGVIYTLDDASVIETYGLVMGILRSLPLGIPFAASLLGILTVHEFGHYFAARYHRSPVSLPYFLPFPGSLFGTLGAFIRLKSPPKNRRALLDIGLAGPLAGLAVAIPILILGLSLSEVASIPADAETLGFTIEGNSILYLALKYMVTGEWLPTPADFGNLSPALYWIRYFFLGLPMPFGGRDVLLHPVAWAGWAGLLVTSLNLIPAGQLDGGHVLYVLLGDRARRVWPFIVAGLVALGMVWSGWFLWAAMIFFMGRTYARPLNEITPLDPRRRALALFGLVVFILVFIPVPLRSMMG